jgi:hypothetical protein
MGPSRQPNSEPNLNQRILCQHTLRPSALIALVRIFYLLGSLTSCQNKIMSVHFLGPSDHHIGQHLKSMVCTFYKNDFELNRDIWCTDSLSASERRQKVAEWAAGAWAILRAEADRIRQCFIATGFLIARDGSEDALIQIPNVPAYRYS